MDCIAAVLESTGKGGNMILSVSRRTDIPAFYADWFLNRIKDGYLYVRNPMAPHQVSRVAISPDVVDCIVFWTKDPGPMLPRLDELEPYPYYFQFTLTGYGKDIEPNVPHKRARMIPVFQELSRRIGAHRVIWRYDPIIFTDRYTPEYHLTAFHQIAGALRGYTSRCVVSFVDLYAKNRERMRALGSYPLPENRMCSFAGQLAAIANENGMRTSSCAEKADLSPYGIERGCCIDKALIEQLIGRPIRAGKDRNQRKECGCIESIETGTYDTCRHGCIYCYANNSPERVLKNTRSYSADSPILCGQIAQEDRITERSARSLKENGWYQERLVDDAKDNRTSPG